MKITLRISPTPLFAFFLFTAINVSAQQSVLSVESIMQDPKWMGTFPSQVSWDEQGEHIYFNYNRDQDPEDSLYRISVESKLLEKVNWEEERKLVPSNGVYNDGKTKKAYIKNNSLRI
ncbi:MAG TPA: hypothetical protein VK014_07700, partial [Cyclobacteriaceae bacterium]|nr:hypothetical protein [Cyclobacteriaceae bacterium]